MENGEASSEVLADENAGEPPRTQEENVEDPRDLRDIKAEATGFKTPRKRNVKKAPAADHGSSSEDEKAVPQTSERPARERKSIDRFSDSIEKEKVKEFRIRQGKGTCLKDIPNVALKLSKRKRNDEYLHLLHKLIYGKRAKPNVVKANVLEFSGCVWGIKEEREKAKMKERLEKCVKESLLQLTEILDLPIPKATSKKEEIVLQLLHFFDSPHKATDKLLGEEEQKEKGRRKSATKGSKRTSSGGRPSKKQKADDRDHGDDENEDESDQEEETEKGSRRTSTGGRPSKKQKADNRAHLDEEDGDENDNEDELEESKSKNRRTSKKSAMSTAKKAVQVKSRRKTSKSEETDEEDEEIADPKSKGSEQAVRSSEESEAHDEEEPEEHDEEEPKEPNEEKAEELNKEAEEEEHEQQNDVPKKSTGRKRASKTTSKTSNNKPSKTKSVYDPEGELEDEIEVEEKKSKSLNKVSKKREAEGVTSSKGKKRSTTKNKEEKVQRVAKTKKGARVKEEEETESSSIPSDDDLRGAICELLRDADFSKVTFTDVVKQLGVKFSVDLTPHKAHVKLLIQEEISKLVDEEDEGEDEEHEQEQDVKG